MTLDNLTTINQLHEFLSGTDHIDFVLSMSKDEKYEAINKLLSCFDYPSLQRSDKGTMIAFLQKISGYSRQNITLMINRYCTKGKLERYHQTSRGFKTIYTKADKRLLAQLDQRHDTPNGLMVKKLCYRAYHQFNEKDYERLANISVAHIYNLRRSSTYINSRYHYEKTKKSHKAQHIGERRPPRSHGKPSYIRSKGKVVKKYCYKDMMTPYEKFKSFDNSEEYLKTGETFHNLDDFANKLSDNQAADLLGAFK